MRGGRGGGEGDPEGGPDDQVGAGPRVRLVCAHKPNYASRSHSRRARAAWSSNPFVKAAPTPTPSCCHLNPSRRAPAKAQPGPFSRTLPSGARRRRQRARGLVVDNAAVQQRQRVSMARRGSEWSSRSRSVTALWLDQLFSCMYRTQFLYQQLTKVSSVNEKFARGTKLLLVSKST